MELFLKTYYSQEETAIESPPETNTTSSETTDILNINPNDLEPWTHEHETQIAK